jgi:hypothetical protein
MKFTLSAQLSPSGEFGVPQDKCIVVPAASKVTIHHPVIDLFLRKVAGHGSMSVYRRDDEAIRESLQVDEFKIRFSDNYVFVELESDNYQDALERSQKFLERFTIQLSVRLRRSVSYEIFGLIDEEKRRYSIPEFFDFGSVATYSLSRLREAIHAAAELSGSVDESLARASQYFEHAVFLYEKRTGLARPGTRHFSALISSVFLSLAKAVTILVGDPSSDRDHQSRYKKFGLSGDFYEKKIKRVWDLRNSYDVAHHDLSGHGAEVVEQNYGEALETTVTILAHYIEYLKNK